MMQASLTRRLARHLARPVGAADRQHARRHLLDWLGCVAGALGSDVAPVVRGLPGSAVQRAAWLGNKLEMDDVHRDAILHPGPVIWPSVLAALGPATTMDGLLDAAVRGYEATIAIGSTFDAHHYAHWHTTTTAGIFGAAVAALSAGAPELATAAATGWEDRLVDALGLAGSVSGGLWQMRHEPGDAKQWHIAHAVATGLHAASAVRAGARAPQFVLEGPQGLHAAATTAPRPLALPAQWRLHEVSFKPWAACRHAHPAIDAALALKDRLGHLDGPITVETYADALTFCDRPAPTSEIEAKFSIQHAVGLVALAGAPQPADFDAAAVARTAAVRARVALREDPEFTTRYPAHFGARVRCGDAEITLEDCRGDPERPIGEPELLAKAGALLAHGGRGGDLARVAEATLRGDDPVALVQLLEDWLP